MDRERMSRDLAAYIADPTETRELPSVQETHPITGANSLSWPVIPYRFELPVPNARAAWSTGKLQNLFLHGSIDLMQAKLQYGNRIEIGQSAGVGERQILSLSQLTDIQMEDLGTASELVGLSKVNLILPNNQVTLILNHRNCEWPKDTTNLRRGKYTGITAMELSLNAYRHAAQIGFSRYVEENSMQDFYTQWAFLYRYRGQMNPRMDPQMRQQLGLPDNFSLRTSQTEDQIENLVRTSFYDQWVNAGVLLP